MTKNTKNKNHEITEKSMENINAGVGRMPPELEKKMREDWLKVLNNNPNKKPK